MDKELQSWVSHSFNWQIPSNNTGQDIIFFRPSAQQFFILSLIHKGLNTNDKYQSKHPTLYHNPNRCILRESMDHLFSTCSFSKDFWLNFYNYIDTTAPSPNNVETLLSKFLDINPNSQRNILLSNICGSTLWCIWLERNNRTFQGGSKT